MAKDTQSAAEKSAINVVTSCTSGKKQKGGKVGQKKKKEGECHYGKKKGHWANECCKKIADKKQKLDQPRGGSSLHVVENEDSSSSDANANTLLCYASSCEDWLMDPGATKHITPYVSDFKTYAAFSGLNQQVTLGDSKTRLEVHGLGTVE